MVVCLDLIDSQIVLREIGILYISLNVMFEVVEGGLLKLGC